MQKFQVTVSDEVAEKVKEFSGYMGLSRSAFCAVAIGEKIMQYEKAYQIIDKFGDKLIQKETEEQNGEG